MRAKYIPASIACTAGKGSPCGAMLASGQFYGCYDYCGRAPNVGAGPLQRHRTVCSACCYDRRRNASFLFSLPQALIRCAHHVGYTFFRSLFLPTKKIYRANLSTTLPTTSKLI